MAVAYVESRFKPGAVSPSGAVGVMQLMPATAFEVAKRHRVAIKDTEQLLDPGVNIVLGSLYMRELLDRFEDTRLAIAGYNGGPAAVAEWMKSAEKPLRIETFPKEETRRYVISVEQTYARVCRFSRWWNRIDETTGEIAPVTAGGENR